MPSASAADEFDAALGAAHQAACLRALALYGMGGCMKAARAFPPCSRDKRDTLLLLASALLVLAPHARTCRSGSAAVRRHPGLARRDHLLGKRMPPNLVLLPLAPAAMAGVLHTYQTLLGRDAGVAMLVLLVTFKMLEMHARRDLFVVVFLCFFLVLTNFFYSQSIGTGLLMLVLDVAC
jgi:hypothetical protein